MKIFVSHSRNYDFINNLYKPLRSSQMNENHQIYLPHEKNKNSLTKHIIKNSDAVLAEVSHASTGQGIELGWANLYKIPIVCLHKNTVKPSASLKNITNTFITYKNTKEMIKKLVIAFDESAL